MKLKDLVNQIVIDPRKLKDYALDPNSFKGGNKAYMFKQHLGYTINNYELLLSQIKAKVMECEVIFTNENSHGKMYRVDIPIVGIIPEQKETVRTGWILENDTKIARLTTLYIIRTKK